MGLRVGYGSTAEDIRLCINPPFNINIGVGAALAALDDDEHVQQFQELLRTELPFMTVGLDRLDLSYMPPTVNFIMVDVGDGVVFRPCSGRVIIRPLNGYQLPQYADNGWRQPEVKMSSGVGKAIRRK